MRRTPHAFTLIEVIITIALFVVLVIAVTQLYLVYRRVIILQQSSIGIALGGSNVMDAIRTAGLQANQVAASHTFSGVSYSSGTTTAIFQIPSIDSSGAVILNTYDYIGIYASSTSVYDITDAAVGSTRSSGRKLLTDDLDALTFTYDNAGPSLAASVIANATTSAVVKGETIRLHLQEHIYLRNL